MGSAYILVVLMSPKVRVSISDIFSGHFLLVIFFYLFEFKNCKKQMKHDAFSLPRDNHCLIVLCHQSLYTQVGTHMCMDF